MLSSKIIIWKQWSLDPYKLRALPQRKLLWVGLSPRELASLTFRKQTKIRRKQNIQFILLIVKTATIQLRQINEMIKINKLQTRKFPFYFHGLVSLQFVVKVPELEYTFSSDADAFTITIKEIILLYLQLISMENICISYNMSSRFTTQWHQFIRTRNINDFVHDLVHNGFSSHMFCILSLSNRFKSAEKWYILCI